MHFEYYKKKFYAQIFFVSKDLRFKIENVDRPPKSTAIFIAF